MKVLVSGSHGLIGSALVRALAEAGHQPVRLVRSVARGSGEVSWDPASGRIDRARLEGLDAVVNLAGHPIGRPWWTPTHKAKVMDSRVRGTALLAEALAGLERPPAVLASGAAVGYYGDRGDEMLTEDSAPGTGFLTEVVAAWEQATEPARAAGIRVATTRTGIVLSARGGALGPLLIPIRLGLGGKLGPGTQYWPWIALDDHVAAIIHILGAEQLSGPVNLSAPDPATCAEIVHTLGKVLGRPTVLPVPSLALKLAVGPEMAEQTVLVSQRMIPAKLLASGFEFRYPELEGALRHTFDRAA